MPIETVMIEALDGVMLQADLAHVEGARGAVVLSHPHPLYGGNRFNPIVGELFRILPDAGFSVVRFDFRGVGSSAGAHDNGDSERLDIVAAIELLDLEGDHIPIRLCGYSFGAVTALNVVDPRVHGWIAIAPPLAVVDRCLAGNDPRPKLVFAPEFDQYSPPAKSSAVMEHWTEAELRVVAGTDHFLGAAVSTIARDVVAHLGEATTPT